MSLGSCAAVLKTASRANPAVHLPYRPRARSTPRRPSRNVRRYDGPASSGSVVGNDPLNRSDPSGLQSFERAGSEEFRRATERGMSDGQAGTKAAMDGLKGIAAGIAVGAVVIAATPEAAAVTATNAARTAATEATAGGSTRGAVSGLVTKAKEIFTGASTNAGGPGGPTNPAVAKVVDSIPKGVQSVFHGCCGEVNAVSKALNAGADVAGSTIRTISIQTGKVIEACSSCQAILTRFGIKF
jgi:hypothetical protein